MMTGQTQEKGGKSSWTRKTFELEVLSPIHVGTREGKITALEYFYHQGKVHLIDEERFANFLLQRKWIDLFVQEAGRGPLSISHFFREGAKIDPAFVIPQVTSRSIPGGDQAMQDFRPFIRDGMGRVFLPGTSLKGLFRTAILYRMVNKEPKRKQEITARAEMELQGHARLPEWKKKRYSESWLQKDLLQSYSLPNAKKGPNTDIFRCLMVRDAYPVGSLQTRIIPIRFLSRRANGEFYWSQRKGHGPVADKDLGIWAEAITEGKFSVEIGWDQRLFASFRSANPKALPVSGLDDLLAAVYEMNSDLRSHEMDFFKRKAKIPSGTTARDLLRARGPSPSGAEISAGFLSSWYGRIDGNLFRIGFGSGMLSTTVNLALPPELREKIRDACGHQRPGDPAPKSRQVWRKSENEALPMGWMRIVSKP